MTDEQLALFAPDEVKVGDVVWWTSGLRYLCATYKDGTPVDKFRPEYPEQVTILEISEPNNFGSRTYIIAVPSWATPIHTVRRWISTDPAVPCPAVCEAYGVYL